MWGGGVSPGVPRDLKVAPASPTWASVLSRSLVLLASRSSRVTTRVSPRAKGRQSPGQCLSIGHRAGHFLGEDLGRPSGPKAGVLGIEGLAVGRYAYPMIMVERAPL
jgi:hypothetical protein